MITYFFYHPPPPHHTTINPIKHQTKQVTYSSCGLFSRKFWFGTSDFNSGRLLVPENILWLCLYAITLLNLKIFFLYEPLPPPPKVYDVGWGWLKIEASSKWLTLRLTTAYICLRGSKEEFARGKPHEECPGFPLNSLTLLRSSLPEVSALLSLAVMVDLTLVRLVTRQVYIFRRTLLNLTRGQPCTLCVRTPSRPAASLEIASLGLLPQMDVYLCRSKPHPREGHRKRAF